MCTSLSFPCVCTPIVGLFCCLIFFSCYFESLEVHRAAIACAGPQVWYSAMGLAVESGALHFPHSYFSLLTFIHLPFATPSFFFVTAVTPARWTCPFIFIVMYCPLHPHCLPTTSPLHADSVHHRTLSRYMSGPNPTWDLLSHHTRSPRWGELSWAEMSWDELSWDELSWDEMS